MKTRAMEKLLADYQQSAREFSARAAEIPDGAWSKPRAEGKWSPAEEVEHVVLSSEILLNQLRGGPEMRVIARGWRLMIIRWTVLPYILRTGRFPRARAPREVRPLGGTAPRAELSERLERAARGITNVLQADAAKGARSELRHPYFGPLTIQQILRLSTVHTRHHAARLPGAARSADPRAEGQAP